ncbi:MAG: hypothetical protein Q8P67_18200 [archaeon]|nr:hypothetical protein [archaeon]
MEEDLPDLEDPDLEDRVLLEDLDDLEEDGDDLALLGEGVEG